MSLTFNAILNPERTLKNRVAVDEATARSAECPIDIQPTDIFIENAPPVPDELHTPLLDADWQTLLDADPQAVVWVEGDAAGKQADALANAVQHKLDEISAAMDAALAAGYACTNGITMDARQKDIAKLDDGYRLALRINATTMNLRDYHNQRHMGVPLADVESMVNELGANWLSQWENKCSLQEQVRAIDARTQLDPADPEYFTHQAALDALALVVWP